MELNNDFVGQMRSLLPAAECDALIDALSHTRPEVSVRVNVARGAAVPAGAQRVPWCEQGFYVGGERPQFTFDTDFQSGLYYVQDASSMFISHVIQSLVHEPVAYLDLCAAPGGKTTAALGALPAGSLVVANEIVPNRARILADNVARQGSPFCLVSNNAPQAFAPLKESFDVVATDVPCSGEGMMRKDATAVEQWTPQLVDQCAARQREILNAVWPSLKSGGLLVYSTCTFNRKENEEMVDYLVNEFGAEPVEVKVQPDWGILPALQSSHPCYRFMPHATRGEGLFMCVLRKPGHSKPGDAVLKPSAKRRGKQSGKVAAIPAEAKKWVSGDLKLSITPSGTVVASPAQWQPLIEVLKGSLSLIHSGTAVCTVKGRKLVPEPELVWSQSLAKGAFTSVEVDYATAIAYLRGESITLPADAPRGYCLVTHRLAPLGFVNNLGSRANNLFPKPLRIISHDTPLVEPIVLQ